MIAILVVLKRYIVTPTTGEPAYIHQETDVRRFPDGTPLTGALSVVEKDYPDALSFEIYRPKTDASAVPRY